VPDAGSSNINPFKIHAPQGREVYRLQVTRNSKRRPERKREPLLREALLANVWRTAERAAQR